MSPPDALRISLPARLSDDVVVLDAYAMADAEAHWCGEDDEMRRRFDAPDPAVPTSLNATREAIARFIANREAGEPNVVCAVRDLGGELVGGCELRRPARECVHVSYWTFVGFR